MRSVLRTGIQSLVTCFFSISLAHATPSLANFILQSLQDNPSIQAAESSVAAAKARERAAKQPLYNPELTLEKENAIDDTEAIGINLAIDWTNKRKARKQVGVANTLLAEAQLNEIRQQVASEILSSLAKYQSEQQALVLVRKRSSLLQESVSFTNKRYSTGDAARVDLDLSQLALAEALAQQADVEVEAILALQKLKALTGLNQINWPELPNTLPSIDSTNKDVDHLMANLPIIQLFNQQYQSSLARIRVAQKERFPDPTIGIQGGRNHGEEESKRLFGLSFSIPLFVRNTYRAEVEAANYDAIEADRKHADIIRQIRAQISSSAERYELLYHAVKQWEQISAKPLGEGMSLIDRLWHAGEMNTTDYLVQLKQRIDSEVAGVELKGQAWEAWGEWLRVSGQVENWLGLNHYHQENNHP
ncbi:MAG: TolC family protein [Gammaproteobacteria bacterium]